ncbi:uncharacterized protein M437DRAFT_87746 [Aureobasidium melanogenum CBS 110374]|uniref:Uncharacterized protein n=1 Tax=Aureobasidium melanogenum (strain CBS 110374) TaxID=1043003 RepID=A0A074WAE0_AURM1|nr:uncharacterized protein M437DRAFT_87746 [Aureobasidium melanogenum CBS 110374]KEQ59486.1 hypothetical protein M437DRAFT_87746 [Aureobasidium melanogenum CBS 110374]
MEPPKAASEESAKLDPDQNPTTLSKEDIRRLIRHTLKISDDLVLAWHFQTKNQIKKIKQRESDIQRASELLLKLHEDIARWTSKKLEASANLKELESLVELMKPGLKAQGLD